MALGNDIVDLADPDAPRHAPTSPFCRRVLDPEELDRLHQASDPHRLLWSLWTAKEAAFKALHRRTGVPFEPRRFRVSADGGQVVHPAGTCAIQLGQQGHVLSAVAWHTGTDWAARMARVDSPGPQLTERERRGAHGPASESARRLAKDLVAWRTGVEASRVEILRPGRMPTVHIDKRLEHEVVVSLSHHGHWVAAAVGWAS